MERVVAVDFVDGAGGRRQDEHLGFGWVREDGGGFGIEEDLLADAKPAEIDGGDGAPLLIGDKAIAPKGGSFPPSAAGAREGRQQQISSGNEGRGHLNLIVLRRMLF